jgi:galactokinase
MPSLLSLDAWKNRDASLERLGGLGLGPEAAAPKAQLFERCATLLQGMVGASPAVLAFYVPGRIEVLGKHTDYGGGHSLLTAVERGFCALAAPRADGMVRILPAPENKSVEFPLDVSLAPVAGQWSNYAMTSAKRIAKNFSSPNVPLHGADIVFASDLPPAAGMSSSSALLTLIFLILARVNRISERPEYQREIKSLEDLAGYLGTVENGQNFGSLAGDKGVGTFGGSEDHTAMLCCTPRQFSQYSFRPVVAVKRVDLPANWTLAIATSGIAAEKTGGAREGFNRLSRIMSVVVDTLNVHYHSTEPHLAALIRAHPLEQQVMLEVLRRYGGAEFSGQVLAGRFDQFFQESQRIIPAVVEALSRGDVTALGPLVDRSQALAESGLANQTPQTSFLAHSARTLGSVRQGGAAAASAFGAGFGGSAWAIVQTPADAFLREWHDLYQAAFPRDAATASFFLTGAGPAAAEL